MARDRWDSGPARNADGSVMTEEQLRYKAKTGNRALQVGDYTGDKSETFDANSQRYLDKAAASTRPAVQLDRSQSLQSRGLQMGSLGLLGQAAAGGAPSRAAALGQAGASDAMRAQMAQAAGARGAGAAIGGANRAVGGAADAQTQVAQQALAARNAEMAQARNAFTSGATGVRAGDIGEATTQAQLEAQQRQLNDARRLAYNQMEYGVRAGEMDINAEMDRRAKQVEAEAAAYNINQQAADDKEARDTTMAASMAVMGMASDERAKRNIIPMGSLGHLMQRGRNA